VVANSLLWNLCGFEGTSGRQHTNSAWPFDRWLGQALFEQAGIEFIDEDELGGFGVRMAKKKKKR
jgi:hypothetical protein